MARTVSLNDFFLQMTKHRVSQGHIVINTGAASRKGGETRRGEGKRPQGDFKFVGNIPLLLFK